MKRKILLFGAVLFLSLGLNAQFIEQVYDFNDLELGNLDGQDGWSTVVNSGGAPNEMDVANEYLGVTSHDGSQAIFYGQAGPNYGRTGSRTSDENFTFDFTQSGTVEIEIDIFTGWWGSLFGFGHDANGNGYLMKAIETVINIEDNEGGFGFHIADHSYPNMYFFMPDGSTINFTYPFESSNGWHTYKFFLDLDANDGAGSISLFVKEIGGSYAPVSEISDLNLGMTPGSNNSSDPANWTKVFLHGTGGTTGFDNMILKQPDTGGLLYQYITFLPLDDHLTTDAPFTIDATSSQGLEVQFEVTSGPATVNGNLVTLIGEPGIVEITASQPGNDDVAPAVDVVQSFEVIDPLSIIPEIEIRNAVDGEDVRMPELMEMQLTVATNIEYPDLLSISQAKFDINGNIVNGYETNNGFYVANWLPTSYGNYDATVTVTSSGGATISENVNFDVVPEAETMEFTVLDEFVIPHTSTIIDTSIILPSFAGTYSSVKAVLEYACPCEPWDVTSSVKIRGANGEWMELFKYISPYGVACDDEVDITDFVSQLQGKVDFSFNFPQSVLTLKFVYEAGTPEYKYSWVESLWQKDYPFGSYNNLQPLEIHTLNFGSEIEKAHIRLMCSGHGWGENNTSNAAEFYDATHHIKLNGNVEFNQRLWQTCNPNPVGCQPQNGTWYYDRHGWCPGTIPMLWQFDITDFISIPDLELQYEFAPDYVDLCSSTHPDCVSGVTCPDCNSTYNPVVNIGGGLITFSDRSIITSAKAPLEEFKFEISPNPSTGIIKLSSYGEPIQNNASIEIINLIGEYQAGFNWDGSTQIFDLSFLPKGAYLINIKTESGLTTKKIIIN